MKSNTKTALTAQVQTAFSDAQSSDNPLPAVPGPWDEPAGFAPEPSAPPIDCEADARRAAADAETGGSAGRPAFAAPKRRPPREGEIDTRRIAARLRHN